MKCPWYSVLCEGGYTMSFKEAFIGDHLTPSDLAKIAIRGQSIAFTEDYKNRVNKGRQIVDQWIKDGKAAYGITTGFGSLSTTAVPPDQLAKLQENILLSHAISVGEPLDAEAVRAIMLMMLQNMGQGVSGVRLSLLEALAAVYNAGIVPWAPGDGSVGYLSIEAHIALVLMGKGQAHVDGELVSGTEALARKGLQPIAPQAKEGLALISGTTSVTALATLATTAMQNALATADSIAAMTLEVSGGLLAAFSEPLMAVRNHPHQAATAQKIRHMLGDSASTGDKAGTHLQDALSIRCISQLHGAVKKTVADAYNVLDIEVNSCCDNPIVWNGEEGPRVISGCNADSSYVGLEMDSLAMGTVMIAKMSERRTNRLLDGALSGKPSFLVANPGLNSGLMLTQYTQAGLINEMRVLAHPAVIDNTPTCANQEDYVGMGYTAAKKARRLVDKLEYVLAFELLAVYQSYYYVDRSKMSSATKKIFDYIAEHVPALKEDTYLHPYVEWLRKEIHEGTFGEVVNQ